MDILVNVLVDQKLGHPDLLLGHRTKCLCLHYLCKQLTCGHQICIVCLPSPPLDNIQVMMIVWRLRGNIIRTALYRIVWHNVHSLQHTYVSSSYRSNRLGLPHWDPYAVCRGGCLELYYCNMVEWFWWDQAWSWRPTRFLQCFDTVGLVIWPVKIFPEMTYYVSSGTLNPTLTHSLHCRCILHGCNSCLGFDLLFRSQGSKWTKTFWDNLRWHKS